MSNSDDSVLIGLVIDEQGLSLQELACACGVDEDWLRDRLEAGLLFREAPEQPISQFASPHLHRARRLRALEQDFDANPELAALVVDLLEEIQMLRAQLSERD